MSRFSFLSSYTSYFIYIATKYYSLIEVLRPFEILIKNRANIEISSRFMSYFPKHKLEATYEVYTSKTFSSNVFFFLRRMFRKVKYKILNYAACVQKLPAA